MGRAASRAAKGALVEHPRLQPFVDHLPDDAVRDSLVEELPQMLVIDGVEVFGDIDVHHPPVPLLHEPIAQSAKGVMGRAAWSEAVRAGQEIRLVNRLQQQQDCPLRHLIFQRRDAQGPSRAVRFRDVVPSHRWRDIPARLDAHQEIHEIGLQVCFVVVRCHAVDARRAILARPSKRLKHPFEVDQVMQRGQRPLGMLPRQIGYPDASWAHVRRRFFELAAAGPAPIASEALERIAKLYAVESEVRGRSADERRDLRQEKSRPAIDDLESWLRTKLGLISQKTKLAEAIRYALSRWEGLTRFLDDGRIEIDSNVVERSIRPIALNRKNALFAGSDGGGEHWAVIASLIETCKLNAVDPTTYLADVITKIVNGHPNSQIDDLLPWAYPATPTLRDVA